MKLSTTVLGLTASLAAAPLLAETQRFDISGFDQLSIAAGIEANIVAGPDFEVIAEARNQRVLRKLDIELHGHTLYINRKTNLRDWVFGNNTNIQVTISLPELRDVSVSSGAAAFVSGSYADDFSGSASSGAVLEIDDLTTDTVDFSVSSGANIHASGRCHFLEVSVSSGATLDAEGLRCQTVDVSSSSGASASVFASEVLDSSASSGGSVQVYGAPDQTDISDSSGGDTDMRN